MSDFRPRPEGREVDVKFVPCDDFFLKPQIVEMKCYHTMIQIEPRDETFKESQIDGNFNSTNSINHNHVFTLYLGFYGTL